MWLKVLAVAVFAFHFSIDPGWGEVIKMSFLFPLGVKVAELYWGCWGSSPDVSQCRSSPCSFPSPWQPNYTPRHDGFSLGCPSVGSRTALSSWPWVECWSAGDVPDVGGWRPGPAFLTTCAWPGWDNCIALLESSDCEKRGITVLWWTWGCAPSLPWIENCFPSLDLPSSPSWSSVNSVELLANYGITGHK